MTGFSDPILTGDGTLIRAAEKSVDYQPGVSGWQIERDGDAEFNNLTARGTVEVGPANGRQVIIRTDAQVGVVEFPTHAATELKAAQIQGQVGNEGGANEYSSIAILGPYHQVANDEIYIILSSQNADGSSNANVQIGYFDAIPGPGVPLLIVDKTKVQCR